MVLSLLLVLGVAAPATDYNSLEVVGRTGDAAHGITSISPAVSINDKGLVAFKGRYNNPDRGPSDNLFVWNPETKQVRQLEKDYFAYRAPSGAPEEVWQTFSDMVQINNNGQVATRRWLNALVYVGPMPFGSMQYMPLTYLELWDATKTMPGPDVPVQLYGGTAGGAALFLSGQVMALNPGLPPKKWTP